MCIVWCNVTALCVEKGQWNQPPKQQQVGPCVSGHSMTSMNRNKLVVFGGFINGGVAATNAVYEVNLAPRDAARTYNYATLTLG